jgi:hypothetical protein
MTIKFTNDSPLAEIVRCHREIAEIERLIESGHPDQEGLCMALLDWSAELALIEQEIPEVKPPRDE